MACMKCPEISAAASLVWMSREDTALGLPSGGKKTVTMAPRRKPRGTGASSNGPQSSLIFAIVAFFNDAKSAR